MPSQGATAAIDATLLFDGEQFLKDYSVILAGDTIERVVPRADRPDSLDATALDGGILSPGLVDLQVNGGGGVLLNNDPSREGVERVAAAHLALGTTTLLPTVMSDSTDVMKAAVQSVREARDGGCRAVAGIHIEGPFFEPSRRGAHRADRIRSPTGEDLDWLCSLGSELTVLLTLAPEHVDTEVIQRLHGSGIILCAGHTDARYDQMREAADAGLAGVTHLYNAMRQTGAREPGVVGAALGDDRLWAGIIADGHHVHASNIGTAFRAKPPGKLVLVSDAMATVGSRDDLFDLYGERLSVREGRLVNRDGVLAGSAIALIDAVQFTAEQAHVPLAECLRMASRYPAQVIGLGATLGRIAPGYRADLVHFDDRYRVRRTWSAGVMREPGAG